MISPTLQYLFDCLKAGEKGIKSIKSTALLSQLEEIDFYLVCMSDDIEVVRSYFREICNSVKEGEK